MKTISQVAKLTGVSVRTLQYYDEIGLLKPTETTLSGYRMYNENALERLQQILFFKELDFKLKDIKDILNQPDFDKIKAYGQQKELLCLKRTRLDRLITLLGKLEKGEQCMSFHEFDLSEYIDALEQFKTEKTEEVIKHWGSVEDFDKFIQKIKDDESNVAQLAIKQFGSVEKYTQAMKYNLEHFSELMSKMDSLKENIQDVMKKNDELHFKLTSDMTRNPASPEVQATLHEIIEFSKETNPGVDMGEGYWDMLIESYSNDKVKDVTDNKYGQGASAYLAKALQFYFHGKQAE